jgi:hypothetical protein
MNSDDINRMAREAHLPACHAEHPKALARFAARVEEHLISQGYRKCAEGQRTTQFCGMVEAAREEEREACAKVCDEMTNPKYGGMNDEFETYLDGTADCAAAIRARRQA